VVIGYRVIEPYALSADPMDTMLPAAIIAAGNALNRRSLEDLNPEILILIFEKVGAIKHFWS
jgi:hypothetical protein